MDRNWGVLIAMIVSEDDVLMLEKTTGCFLIYGYDQY